VHARTIARKLLIATAATAAFLAASSPARAASLGVANDFYVFVLNDLVKTNVDAHGHVAVDGNATLDNYSTGSHASAALLTLLPLRRPHRTTQTTP
jgi:hypothetical protein